MNLSSSIFLWPVTPCCLHDSFSHARAVAVTGSSGAGHTLCFHACLPPLMFFGFGFPISGTVVGVVIYTGRELRSVMNTSNPRSKVCERSQCTLTPCTPMVGVAGWFPLKSAVCMSAMSSVLSTHRYNHPATMMSLLSCFSLFWATFL
jgi:hypothetical protein